MAKTKQKCRSSVKKKLSTAHKSTVCRPLAATTWKTHWCCCGSFGWVGDPHAERLLKKMGSEARPKADKLKAQLIYWITTSLHRWRYQLREFQRTALVTGRGASKRKDRLVSSQKRFRGLYIWVRWLTQFVWEGYLSMVCFALANGVVRGWAGRWVDVLSFPQKDSRGNGPARCKQVGYMQETETLDLQQELAKTKGRHKGA